MKKIILFLLILMFSVILISCGNSEDNNEAPTIETNNFSDNKTPTVPNEGDDNQTEVKTPTPIEPPIGETQLPDNPVTPTPPVDNELGNVLSISSKYKVNPTSEPDYNKQIGTINPLGNLTTVWDYYRGDGVVVAVIDSGFDINHPEFFDEKGVSRVIETSAYIYTDNSGRVQTKVGSNNVKITDGDSHGTMCAGILGSSVNGTGITGIAPNCKLMLIKIDKKSKSFAEAFKYAADNGAKVISTSLGTYPNPNGESYGDVIFPAGEDISKTFNANIEYAYNKGVTIIAATGNSRTTTLSYPAGCNYVIGAGGLNYNSMDKIWDNGYEGSNYNGSKVYVDCFAPSDGIYAPGFDTSENASTYWGDAKGTSFAAPIIAGAAALYFEKYPTHTNVDFENALKSSCVNINSANGNKNMGWGRIDISNLLSINEDIKELSFNPTVTINQSGTYLQIVDEAGWDFRTLHLFNMTFKDGYGYTDFERYLTYTYGSRTATNNYQLEGTKRTWAYTDEGYIGDYYLCVGNTIHATATNYDYYFPHWVTGFSYQIVNNNNWMPEGGNHITLNNGYGKEVKSYFWYNNSTSFGLTQVVGNNYKMDVAAINVKIETIGLSSNTTSSFVVSIFDYFIPNDLVDKENKKFIGYFVDEKCTILYNQMHITTDTTLYALYK